MGLDAGDKAPAFKIATDDGETLSSSGLKGARYVVYFYPKDDTSRLHQGGDRLFRRPAKIREGGRGRDRRVQGQPGEPREIPQKTQIEDRAGHRTPTSRWRRTGACGCEKSLYGRKYMGLERATFLVNAKGVIEQAWHKVKVPGHVEAVLEAVKAP